MALNQILSFDPPGEAKREGKNQVVACKENTMFSKERKAAAA